MIITLENAGLGVAHKIAKILAKTKITPRQVTVARFVITAPLSLYFFSRGVYLYNVIGLFFYMLLAILDWVDGSLAKIKKLPIETKPLGVFIDHSLDRVLVLIVLSSIFYAGLNSDTRNIWVTIVLLYFSAFFFLTTILYEFNQITGLEYEKYPEIKKELYKNNKCIFFKDKLLWNLLYVSDNSIARFCFTVSYPLFLGIIINQLISTFIFITIMSILRLSGIFFIIYHILNIKKTNLALIKVLKKYVEEEEKERKTHAKRKF